MEQRGKVIITLLVLVFIVSGFYLFTEWISKTTGYSIGEDERTKLAQCLSGKDTRYYGSIYCSECEKQKELFGVSFKFIDNIECYGNSECEGFDDLPVWIIDNQSYYGYYNISSLKEISGC